MSIFFYMFFITIRNIYKYIIINNIMVLAELGKKINSALAKLNKATVVDEEMVKSKSFILIPRCFKRHRNSITLI